MDCGHPGSLMCASFLQPSASPSFESSCFKDDATIRSHFSVESLRARRRPDTAPANPSPARRSSCFVPPPQPGMQSPGLGAIGVCRAWRDLVRDGEVVTAFASDLQRGVPRKVRVLLVRTEVPQDRDLQAAAQAVAVLPRLEHLVCFDTTSKPDGQPRCYRFTRSNTTKALLAPLGSASSPSCLRTLRLRPAYIRINEAHALAPLVAAITSLESLSLGLSHLNADECVAALAPTLASLPLLSALDLRDNNIRDCGAAALAASMPGFAALRVLDVASNEITGRGAAALAKAVAASERRVILQLAGNAIGEEGVRALAPLCGTWYATPGPCEAWAERSVIDRDAACYDSAQLGPVTRTDALRTLDLKGARAGDDGMQALAVWFASMAGLTALRLGGNYVTAIGAATLAPNLQCLSALRHLDLQQNCLGPGGAKALAGALPSLPVLRVLDLAGNVAAEGLRSLAPCFAHLPHLEHLDLSTNLIDANTALTLTRALAGCKHLRTLLLNDNFISVESAQDGLAARLAAITALESLSLASNCLGDEDMVALVSRLAPRLSRLRLLDVSYNSVTPSGAAAMAPHLARMTALRALLMSHNVLGSEGAVAFARHLPEMVSLRRLHLNRNRIGAPGARVLARQMMQMTELEEVAMCGNPIGAEGVRCMALHLPHVPKLHSLTLCHIIPEGSRDMSSWLKTYVRAQLAHVASLRL